MEKFESKRSLAISDSFQINKFVPPPISPAPSYSLLTHQYKHQGRKHFIIAIIRFLRDEIDHNACSESQRVSLTCAMQSLEYAYKMENIHENPATMGPTIDLWKIYMYPTMHQLEIMTVAHEDLCQAVAFKQSGMDLMKNGEICAAIDFFNRAVHLNPNYFENYYLRAKCYHMLHKYRSAIEDAQLSLLRHPEHSDSYCILGSSYYQIQALKKSIDCFIQAYRYDRECSFYILMVYSVHDELVAFNKKCPANRYFRTELQLKKCITDEDMSHIVDNGFPYISHGSTCNSEVVRRFCMEISRKQQRRKKIKRSRKCPSPHVVTQPRVPACTGAISRYYIPELPWTSRYKTYSKKFIIEDFAPKPFTTFTLNCSDFMTDDLGTKPLTTLRPNDPDVRTADHGPEPLITVKPNDPGCRTANLWPKSFFPNGPKPIFTLRSNGSGFTTADLEPKPLTTVRPNSPDFKTANISPKSLTAVSPNSPGFRTANLWPKSLFPSWPKPITTLRSNGSGFTTADLEPKPLTTVRPNSPDFKTANISPKSLTAVSPNSPGFRTDNLGPAQTPDC